MKNNTNANMSDDGDENALIVFEADGVRRFAPFGVCDALAAEPSWYRGHATPHYEARHARFRAMLRATVDELLVPHVGEWDEAGGYPARDLPRTLYQRGLFGAAWPEHLGGQPPEGGWDIWYDIIYADELARCGSGGLVAALGSIGIGLPPLLAFGSEELQQKYAPPVIRGEKIIALCITEPLAGSDVAQIRTTAVEQADGSFVLNGQKKFITSGMTCDLMTVIAKDGDSHTLFLVESVWSGVTRRRLPTSGWWTSSTALISFSDVRVPAENVIGERGAGLLAVFQNFNLERFHLAVGAQRYSRLCLEDAFQYAQKRKTFGKVLYSHQVVRHKLVQMAERIEAGQALLEQVALQIQSNTDSSLLAGQCAMLKNFTAKTLEICAREAAQILGGNSFQRGDGPGGRIERINREVRVAVVGGGSLEIMDEFVSRRAKM